MSLARNYSGSALEAGVDEAGRGPLAGPVFAAAVILPPDFNIDKLRDSKQLSAKQRAALRVEIESGATAWAVRQASVARIDEINILQASIEAMEAALLALDPPAEFALIDGNRFRDSPAPHLCVVKGDAKFAAIAAASILAKTYRDERMLELHEEYPRYGWADNKGYPTRAHRLAVQKYGRSPHHRRSFRIKPVNF